MKTRHISLINKVGTPAVPPLMHLLLCHSRTLHRERIFPHCRIVQKSIYKSQKDQSSSPPLNFNRQTCPSPWVSILSRYRYSPPVSFLILTTMLLVEPVNNIRNIVLYGLGGFSLPLPDHCSLTPQSNVRQVRSIANPVITDQELKVTTALSPER